MSNIGSIDSAVGIAVRRLRQRCGWDDQALAAAIGVSGADIRAIEAGNRRLSAVEAHKLVRALGVKVEELYADPGCEAQEAAVEPGR